MEWIGIGIRMGWEAEHADGSVPSWHAVHWICVNQVRKTWGFSLDPVDEQRFHSVCQS